MKALQLTSACGQVRQHWVLVCIFPLKQLFGLTGIENRRSQIARNPSLPQASSVNANCSRNLKRCAGLI